MLDLLQAFSMVNMMISQYQYVSGRPMLSAKVEEYRNAMQYYVIIFLMLSRPSKGVSVETKFNSLISCTATFESGQ